MRIIREDIKENVYKVTDMLINYKNKKNLSWLKVYEEVLKKLDLEDKLDDNIFLNSVIYRISELGFDIIGEPFSLKYYR